MVIGMRQRIVEEIDGSSSQTYLGDIDDDDDAVREAASKLRQPSNEAMAKFEDYRKFSFIGKKSVLTYLPKSNSLYQRRAGGCCHQEPTLKASLPFD